MTELKQEVRRAKLRPEIWAIIGLVLFFAGAVTTVSLVGYLDTGSLHLVVDP